MFRTICACVVTAVASVAVTAGTGIAVSHGGGKRIYVGESGYFPVVDLFCLPEDASGAPRFDEPGVACNAAHHEYTGRGVWFSKNRIVITSPPNGKVIYSVRR
jgi:hypothetical protein